MSTPLTLEQRIAALEARVATLNPTEPTLPTYLSVNPATGAVTAQFTGGILLSESTGALNLAGPQSLLSWQDANAVIREQIGAFSNVGFHTLQFLSEADVADTAQIKLITKELGTAGQSLIQMAAMDNATGLGQTINLWNSVGQSGFLQLTTAAKTLVKWGTVTSGGVIVTSSGDFTVSHPSTGNYTITYNTSYTNAPSVVFTPQTASGLAAIIQSNAAGSVSILFFATSGGASTDTAFNFIAIGV